VCHNKENGWFRLINTYVDKTVHENFLCPGYHKVKIEVRQWGIFEIQLSRKSIILMLCQIQDFNV